MIKTKIIEIADALKNHKEDNIINRGMASSILYWGYMCKHNKKKYYLDICYTKIEQALNLLHQNANYNTFAGGHLGLLWVLCHLRKHNLIDVEKDFFEDYDNIALEFAIHQFSAKNYDYLHGALGASLYFFERLPDKNAKKALYKILDGLLSLYIEQPTGITWQEYYLTATQQDNNKVYYSLGLAHGIPSIISTLTLFSKYSIRKNIVNKTLHKTINWVLSKKNNPSKNAVFPYAIVEDGLDIGQESRLAWCYGDLGLSYSIFMAGQVTSNTFWKNEAIAIALKATTRRDPLENKYLNAGICHGTSGIAYIFFKYFLHTGIKAFAEASSFWQQQTSLLAKYKSGAGGYKKYDPTLHKKINDYGLLEGIAGIGLVWASIANKRYLDWDRCLLLS